MARFRFRLEPVLDHRERIERGRQGEHARATAALLAATAQRDDLAARRDTSRDELTRNHATMDGDTLRATYVHLDFLDRAIVAAEGRIAACAAAAEQTRLALVSASRDRKVLETLKLRRSETHAAGVARVEQNELDDHNARAFERAVTAAAALAAEGLPT